MADLIVRNLDTSIVLKLKQQAAGHARIAEAEHRAILEAALTRTRRRPLAAVLSDMPNAGRDEDFERRCPAVSVPVFISPIDSAIKQHLLSPV